VTLASGCGYTFMNGAQLLKLSAGRPVDVRPFENSSLEADAATIAGRAAARGLAERGATVSSNGDALQLSGTIDSLTSSPAGAGAWHIDAKVRLVLVDPQHGNRVLGHSLVVDGENYLNGTDVEGSDAARRIATARILERMVGTALDRLAP
jgi:hypothetical protein